MIGHEALELLSGVLVTLIQMMRHRIRLASAPDGHDQGVGHELGGHVGIYRPTDDMAREWVDNGSHIEPALSHPQIGKIGHPLLVRPIRGELAIQHIRHDDGTLAVIL